MTTLHTVTKGDITKLHVAARLMERGERVLQPLSENERYDLALDRGGALYRIQCKTGRYRQGCVIFAACSSMRHLGKKGATRYVGQVEAFGVFCLELRKIYLIPIGVIGDKQIQYLRVDQPKNRQQKGLVYASQFEI